MKTFALACALTLLVSAGVSAGTAVAPVDPQFAAISQIVILPVVDSRTTNKDVKVNLKDLRNWAQKTLVKYHHFAVSQSDVAAGDLGTFDQAKIAAANPEWIRRLGPPDARWVMVVGLGDVQGTRRYTTSASVFGFLFDKESGRLLWGAQASGEPSPPLPVPYNPQIGALNNAVNQSNAQLADALTKVLFPSLTRGDILGHAMYNLLSGPGGLPKLPKKGK